MRQPSPPGWERAELIRGWYRENEARLLAELCTGPWCEIGCYEGRSTTILAETGETGFAIDTFQGSTEMPDDTDTYAAFMRNVGDRENVIVIQQSFERAARFVPQYGFSLLHLDADHSYAGTERAFELYAPKLLRDGHVFFHDARGGGWPEVERYVATLEWPVVAEVDLTIVLRKP